MNRMHRTLWFCIHDSRTLLYIILSSFCYMESLVYLTSYLCQKILKLDFEILTLFLLLSYFSNGYEIWDVYSSVSLVFFLIDYINNTWVYYPTWTLVARSMSTIDSSSLKCYTGSWCCYDSILFCMKCYVAVSVNETWVSAITMFFSSSFPIVSSRDYDSWFYNHRSYFSSATCSSSWS